MLMTGMHKLKILTWNILRGGGERTSKICDQIQQHDPDIVVLTEVRNGERGDSIRESLAAAGYQYQHIASAELGTNTVGLFSRIEYQQTALQSLALKDKKRCLLADFGGFTVMGVYFAQNKEKEPLWEYVLSFARENVQQRAIIVGDFNTGDPDLDGGKFYCSRQFRQLSELWCDSWRFFHHQETQYSWISNRGNGYRVDHIFVSPVLKKCLVSADYSHCEREVRPPISDHSALILGLQA